MSYTWFTFRSTFIFIYIYVLQRELYTDFGEFPSTCLDAAPLLSLELRWDVKVPKARRMGLRVAS